MPLRRGQLPTDDIGVLWWGNNGDLVERLLEFIEGIRPTELTAAEVADRLQELLTNPGPRSHLVELGDPPRRGPVVPPRPVLTLPPPFAEHAARRAPDPGE
jgi:hypothetical protein